VGSAGPSQAVPSASKGGRLAAMATSSRLTGGSHRWGAWSVW
jgi:hypothetical protein